MATFLFDGDELKECPYNPNHRVLSRRLLGHMTKCAEEPNAPVLKTCHFNLLHRIHPSQFDAHIVECPDNRQAIREMLNAATNPINRNPQPINPQNSVDTQVDSWEAEAKEGEYLMPGLEKKSDDDQIILSSSSFISQSQLFGRKPAERKRIYNQLAEEVIRKQARVEREELTETEAQELDLQVDTKPKIEPVDSNTTS